MTPYTHSGHFGLKDIVGTVISVGFTMAGMPYVGAFVGTAVGTAVNGGNIGDFAIGLVVGCVSGYAGGTIAGSIAGNTGMNLAGPGTALLRGGLSGSIGGAGTAAIYNGDIGEGALYGAASGMAVSSIVWGHRAYKTEQFIKNNVNFDSTYSSSQRADTIQAIREAGQSPIGQRLFSGFMKSGNILNLSPEGIAGPGVYMGTDRMMFSGNIQGSGIGALMAGEKWGPSMTDGTAFVHELGHTLSGFNVRDPLNVSMSENLYRGWIGTPSRSNYYIGGPNDVPNRSFYNCFIHTW